MKEKNIADLDPNFKQREFAEKALDFYDATVSPIVLEGLAFTNEDGRRCRIPLKTAEIMKGHVVGCGFRYGSLLLGGKLACLRSRFSYGTGGKHYSH